VKFGSDTDAEGSTTPDFDGEESSVGRPEADEEVVVFDKLDADLSRFPIPVTPLLAERFAAAAARAASFNLFWRLRPGLWPRDVPEPEVEAEVFSARDIVSGWDFSPPLAPAAPDSG
jgi:hypothetical protein